MTPHKAIEVLKELKPGAIWTIASDLCWNPYQSTEEETHCIECIDFDPAGRYIWEGSTLDEAMEKVLESLKV